MRCHSVFSCFWPSLPVQFSVVAMLKVATAAPLGVSRSSASRPRLPTRITLFTLPMMSMSSGERPAVASARGAGRYYCGRARLSASSRCLASRPASVSASGLDDELVGVARPVGLVQPFVAQAALVVGVADDVAARVGRDHAVEGVDGLGQLAALEVALADVVLRVVGRTRSSGTSARSWRSPRSRGRSCRRCSRPTPCRRAGSATRAVGRRRGRRRRGPARRGARRRRRSRRPAAGAPDRRRTGARPAAAGSVGAVDHRHRRDRLAQRLDLLRQRRDAHVGVVDLLAHDAEVAAQRVGQQLLVGEAPCGSRRSARRSGAFTALSASVSATSAFCSCWVCSCSMRMSAIICCSSRRCA